MRTKEIQGRLWSTAPSYWSTFFEPFFLPLYKKTLSELRLHENSMLLDAGCGAGLFTHMAIGAGAEVIGVDAAPGLLELARTRNPRNNFLEEDLESLPFAACSFDVITGFNSFQYAGDFSAALTEARRILKPGGRLVIGIWDKPENSDATHILKAISTLLPPLPPGTPGPFALSADGKIESILGELSLKLVHRSAVSCPFLYHSLEEAVNSFMSTGPAAAALQQTTEEEVRKTIARAFSSWKQTEDMYHLQNSFLLFIAEK